MGVVNTTYTFSGTDTITSAKLNNIIDDTTFTSDAIQGTTLQVVSPGKLAVNAGGVTSNELASGAVTQAKLGANVVGNGPAFRAYISSAQSVPAGTLDTKITLSEDFDTNSNFNNSRFTATIAGIYIFSGATGVSLKSGTTVLYNHSLIYKNGSRFAAGSFAAAQPNDACSSVSCILSMNVGDYVELYCFTSSNGNGVDIINSSSFNYLSGCLIRSA